MIIISYCSVSQVRAISGLTSSNISDDDLNTLISMAAYQLNHDIQIKVIRERVKYIDNTRRNLIDGSNTTFYCQNWKGYYLGDLDDDSDVDTDDIIVYLVDPDGTETTATVSSIDDDDCKFVLASAPDAGTKIYVTYVYSPVRIATPDNLLALANAYLAAAYAFTKIDVKKIQKYSIGKLKITQQSQGFKIFYDKYKEIVNQIRNMPLKMVKGEPVTDIMKPF